MAEAGSSAGSARNGNCISRGRCRERIAAARALLIALVFMERHQSRPLTRLVAAAGLIRLAILLMLSLSDYLTRPWDA